jgi:hypothetical protein
MTTPTIDTNQTAKVSRFAKIWPLFLSGLVLIISGSFCLLSFYLFSGVSPHDYAFLSIHYNLMTFLEAAILPAGAILLWIFIWILTALVLAWVSRTVLSKIAILASFAASIPLTLIGFIFGVFVQFSPVDSILLESRSFNLGYFDEYGVGQFYLYECNAQGMSCKTVWQSRSSYNPQSANNLEFDEINRQVEILINGENMYRHPIE